MTLFSQTLSILNLRPFVSIVPSGDPHQSEYTAEADKRRQWLSKYAIPRLSTLAYVVQYLLF